MEMSENERWAWVAGLIEGEGWIGQKGTSGGRPVVDVAMTDEDVVRRLCDWTGFGHVAGPMAPREGQTKPVWRWSVSRRDDAAAVLRRLLPLLGERRAVRAREALAGYEAAGPTKGTSSVCAYGHDISEGSPNLAFAKNGKYTKRRCRACDARRMRKHRERRKE